MGFTKTRGARLTSRTPSTVKRGWSKRVCDSLLEGGRITRCRTFYCTNCLLVCPQSICADAAQKCSRQSHAPLVVCLRATWHLCVLMQRETKPFAHSSVAHSSVLASSQASV